MRPGRQGGFTIVEIMISIVVLALLIMVGIPSFTQFIANSRIRVAADGVLNGMQRTRNEAIRRNACMQVKLTGVGWVMSSCADPDTAIESRPASEGTTDITAVFTPAGDTVSFNGLGRVLATNPGDGSTPFAQVDMDHSSATGGRRLRVVVPTGGGVRMCDPQVSAGDPRACP